MVKVFISYSRVDTEIMQQIYNLLSHAFDVWVDTAPQAIIGGEDWWERIQKEVMERRIFVYLASTSSSKSKWCQKEIELATQHDKYIIPVLLDDVTHFHELSNLQIIDATNYDLAETISRIFAAIVKQLASLDKQKRDADLRLLKKYKSMINYSLLKIIEFGVYQRKVPRDSYVQFIWAFLDLRQTHGTFFFDTKLQNEFDKYAQGLMIFRNKFAALSHGTKDYLEINTSDSNEKTDQYYAKLEEIETALLELRSLHKQLWVTIRQNYPEFDFNDE